MKNKLENTQISNSFDYNILELEQRSIVKQRTEEIKERLKRSAQDIWEIGQKLFEVRSELAYGQFDSWLKAEFGWSRRTAYNFVKVYEAFPERATVAQVSIAASALYQLSSPSTPKQVREEFIQKAKDGEKITRKDIRLAAKQEKPSLVLNATNATVTQPEKTATSQQQIVSIIPQATKTTKTLAEHQDSDDLIGLIEPELQTKGWYSLGEQHFLFYGDTASPQFYQNIPEADLAIAITSSDWDHDWLVDKVESLLLLKESFLPTTSLSTLISMLCEPGGTVLFPWLPDENMIDSAHKLGRIIVAGDPALERCQKAIAKSKLTPKLISPLEKL